ncbi:MAG TPA: hypothetical protein VF435_01320 [Pyrinomonadaceae bacterium]
MDAAALALSPVANDGVGPSAATLQSRPQNSATIVQLSIGVLKDNKQKIRP